MLQPLLEPGATLSGSRGQLFLRASAANAADIKRALEAIDRPARRLEISVRVDGAMNREQRDARVSGSIGSGGVRISGSAQDSRTSAGERVDQRLQVLEGSRALIFAGESDHNRDIASGFEVVPRLAGGAVALDIAQQRQGQRVSTQVQARPGEWVEIGATESRRVWVKVDEVPN